MEYLFFSFVLFRYTLLVSLMMLNFGYAVRNLYARQIGTVAECVNADMSYIIGYLKTYYLITV